MRKDSIRFKTKELIISFIFGDKWARNNCKMPCDLPIKDPNDFMNTESSTSWKSESFCPECHVTVGSDEIQTDICGSCGSVFKKFTIIRNPHRSWRKIYNGFIWITQYKFEDGSLKLIDDKR